MNTTDSNPVETDVLVVGAGPVGLTLAYTLARHGVRCMLIERHAQAGILPKMDLSNPRTMEIFGRLGLAEKIRRAGWPLDARFDVLVGPSLVDAPYQVLRYPSIAEMQAQIAATNDGSLPREPYERISQYHLEALLRRELEDQPTASVRFGLALESFVDEIESEGEGEGAHVRVTARQGSGPGVGDTVELRCRYLVGCDGGNSTVRSLLGLKLSGKTAVSRNYMIFFRCPDLLQKAGLKAFRHFYLAGQRQATLVAQDDLQRWSLHVKIPFDLDVATLDPQEEIRAALGIDLETEILYSGAWTPHLLVADQYARGKVFLAGDAAHQYIPTGGFGMNTGITEADNLAWKLAAVLQGWGGPKLLDSYHEERQPVAVRNCQASEFAAEGVAHWRRLFKPLALEPTDAGRACRQQLADAIDTHQRRSHEQHGIELGYRYTSSAICLHENADAPDPDHDTDSPEYSPSAAPGARLPHAWIEPGVSVHDRCGRGMTLLSLGAAASDVGVFAEEAKAQSVPLTVLELPAGGPLRALYGAALLLLRPDLHVAWRGEHIATPQDATRVLQVATGH